MNIFYPFRIAEKERKVIDDAISEIQNKTCIKFYTAGPDNKNFIYVNRGAPSSGNHSMSNLLPFLNDR